MVRGIPVDIFGSPLYQISPLGMILVMPPKTVIALGQTAWTFVSSLWLTRDLDIITDRIRDHPVKDALGIVQGVRGILDEMRLEFSLKPLVEYSTLTVE